MRIKLKNAFTLVEIMIVVAIVALLATIAIPNLLRAKIEANEASAQATLKLIGNALENYAGTNQNYPTTTTQLLGAAPPYLSVDYFATPHNGYTYAATLTDYAYTVTAIPTSTGQGNRSFSMTTSGVLSVNP